MVGKARMTVAVVAVLTAALLAGCGDSKEKDGKTPATKAPKIVKDIALGVDEKGDKFVSKTTSITSKPGTIKITVANPADAKGQHGVGIDGGAYKDVKGAPVKAGRSTSLTVDVKEGSYEIFDSYKGNRAKGYVIALKVKK